MVEFIIEVVGEFMYLWLIDTNNESKTWKKVVAAVGITAIYGALMILLSDMLNSADISSSIAYIFLLFFMGFFTIGYIYSLVKLAKFKPKVVDVENNLNVEEDESK